MGGELDWWWKCGLMGESCNGVSFCVSSEAYKDE